MTYPKLIADLEAAQEALGVAASTSVATQMHSPPQFTRSFHGEIFHLQMEVERLTREVIYEAAAALPIMYPVSTEEIAHP